MLEKQARYSNGEPFADPSYGPLSHASRASSPFRGAFLDAAPQKPLLKGEGDRLRWWGFAASPHVHPLRQKFFIGAERT